MGFYSDMKKSALPSRDLPSTLLLSLIPPALHLSQRGERADPSSHQDESTSQRLSLNGSQHGNCSTEYNTSAGT